MKYITILDFVDGRVYQYKVGETIKEIEESNLTISEWCEEYMVDKGHNLSSIEWMVHENPQVITK